MTFSTNNQVQVSVEDLMDTLNSVRAEEATKTRTGIAPRPDKAKSKDSDVLGFFRDMFANSQAKAVEAREAIQPEMYRLAKESAYEVSQARQMAGITRSLTEGGGEIGRKPLPEGTTLRPVAKPPMTTMRDVTGTDEGKLDNEQPLRDLASAVANEQIPSEELEPVAKDEADEVVNTLVEQLTNTRITAGKDVEEPAPVTAETETAEVATPSGGLMSRRLDEKGKALPITELRNYTDNYAQVYLKEHEGLKPHKSLEGGKDTAALGVKFSLGLNRKDYSSDAEFAAAVALKHRDKAKAKFGAAKWDALPESVKFTMTDLNYNNGTIGSSGDKADATAAMKNSLAYIGMTTKAGEKASLISLAKRRAWNWNKAASDIGAEEIAKIKQIPTASGGTKFEYLDASGNVIHSVPTSRKPVKLNNDGSATTLTTTRELDM